MFNSQKFNKNFTNNFLIERKWVSYEKELGATNKSIVIFLPDLNAWTTLSKKFIIDNDQTKNYIIANIPLTIPNFRVPIKDRNGIFNNEWASKSVLIQFFAKLHKLYIMNVRKRKAKIINGNLVNKKLNELKIAWAEFQEYKNLLKQQYNKYLKSFEKNQTITQSFHQELSDEKLSELAKLQEVTFETEEEKQRFKNWATKFAV